MNQNLPEIIAHAAFWRRQRMDNIEQVWSETGALQLQALT